MLIVNLIVVFSADEEEVLMCRRVKDPYQGLLNFVGGKVERGESYGDAAYRELYEESGLSEDDISLTHFLSLIHPLDATEIQVFAGKLHKSPKLREELNPLVWVSRHADFGDASRFAGGGQTSYILDQLAYYRDQLFTDCKP